MSFRNKEYGDVTSLQTCQKERREGFLKHLDHNEVNSFFFIYEKTSNLSVIQENFTALLKKLLVCFNSQKVIN